MDPLRNLCTLNFVDFKDFSSSHIEKYIEKNKNLSPRAKRLKILEQNISDEAHINENLLYSNIKLKDDVSNPILQIDSFFKDKDTLILANIDTIFNFTQQDNGYLHPQYVKDFRYALLQPNIGYIQYLQYRLPTSYGFTDCNEEIIPNINNINYGLYDILKKVNTNYLNINCEDRNLAKFITSIVPNVDLVLSSESKNYKENLINCLKILKAGGTFICKIRESDLDKITKYLYLTTLQFKKLSLFKPFLENLSEEYTYVICEDFKNNPTELIYLLENENIETKNININIDFLDYIKKYLTDLLKLKQKLSEIPIVYYMYKCLPIMNLF